jgi:hypothetical protein
MFRDWLLSFCPESFRRTHRPDSSARVVMFARWNGLLQFVLFASLLGLRYAHFISLRAHQWSPVTQRVSDVQESGLFIESTLEFLLYPLSLLLIFFTLEGLLRFAAGLISGDVVPSLPVSISCVVLHHRNKAREDQRLGALPPDTVEYLPEGRVRISSARSRPTWNATVTIHLAAEDYEIEKREPGEPIRPFVFLLRHVPVGKIRRGYEEYDLASATIVNRAAGAELRR